MKEYKCIKDFYIGDVKFASTGDKVQLFQDGITVVNLNGGQKVAHMQGVLDNKEHFVEVRYTAETKPAEDNVNHPKWYTQHPSGVECIEITRHHCFAIGNAIKYLWRAGLKVDACPSSNQKEIEDLEKAVWYIKDRINQLKNVE